MLDRRSGSHPADWILSNKCLKSTVDCSWKFKDLYALCQRTFLACNTAEPCRPVGHTRRLHDQILRMPEYAYKFVGNISAPDRKINRCCYMLQLTGWPEKRLEIQMYVCRRTPASVHADIANSDESRRAPAVCGRDNRLDGRCQGYLSGGMLCPMFTATFTTVAHRLREHTYAAAHPAVRTYALQTSTQSA